MTRPEPDDQALLQNTKRVRPSADTAAQSGPRFRMPVDRFLVTFIAVVAILYFGQEVLIPVALAILLTFMLAPVTIRLQHWGFNKLLAVSATSLFAIAIAGGVLYIVANQFVNLANSLPKYKSNLIEKVRFVRGPMNGGFEKGAETMQDLAEELHKPDGPQPRGIAKVQVVEPPPSPIETTQRVFGPILQPLGTGAIVIVFVIFMLYQREDLRDRLIRLVGIRDLHATTQAMDDAAGRVSQYLLMQTLINTLQGIAVAGGLWFIGVPNALLWGALTVVLRFVPYLGPVVAAAMPIALSFAVFDDWTGPLLTIAWLLTLETLSNNLLEPWLYGTRTGVSQLALLVAAVFWTWLWGPAGLFLATPLTVCMVVMGKYMPKLEFLSILLSDAPVLRPEQRFYQRLLAKNYEEAEDVLDEARKENTAREICDCILLPAMVLAEQDHQRGALDDEERDLLFDQIDELGNALFDAEEARRKEAGTLSALHDKRFVVVALPAGDAADDLAARLFMRQLKLEGFDARACTTATLKSEMLDFIDETEPQVICISALPPAATQHACYLGKRLAQRFPDLPVMVGLWSASGDAAKARERLSAVGTEKVVTSFKEGAEELMRRLQSVLQGVGNHKEPQPETV